MSGYGQDKMGSRNMIDLSETWPSSINHMFNHQFNFMIVYDVGGDWVPLWAVRHKFFDKKKSISKIIIEFC